MPPSQRQGEIMHEAGKGLVVRTVRLLPKVKRPRYAQIICNDYVATCGLSATAYNIVMLMLNRLDKNKVDMTVKELTSILNITSPAVYEAMHLLHEKNLILKMKIGQYLLNPHYFWSGLKDDFAQTLEGYKVISPYEPALEEWEKGQEAYKAHQALRSLKKKRYEEESL